VKRPEPTSRHPLVLFLLGLCIMAGIRYVTTGDAPGTIESELRSWQVDVWGWSLLVGAILFLVGVALQPYDGAPRVRDGILLEQLGSSVLGSAAILYWAVIVSAVGWGGLLSGGVILVLGLACYARWWSIQRHVKEQTQGATADGAH